MKKLVSVLFLFIVCSFATNVSFSDSEIVDITAYRLEPDETITVDGKNDEIAWQKAIPCERTFFLDRNLKIENEQGELVPKPMSQKTEVRVCYNETMMYFYVRCFDQEPVNPGVSSNGMVALGQDATAFFYLTPDESIHWISINPSGGEAMGFGGKKPDIEFVSLIFEEDGWGAEFSCPLIDIDHPAPNKNGVVKLKAGFDRRKYIGREWGYNNHIGQGESKDLMGSIIFPFLGRKELSFEELVSFSFRKKEKKKPEWHLSSSGFLSKQGIDASVTYNEENSDVLEDIAPLRIEYDYWRPGERRPSLNRRGLFNRFQRGIWGSSTFTTTKIRENKVVTDLVLKNRIFSFGTLGVLNKNGRNIFVSTGKTKVSKFYIGATHLHQREMESNVLALDVERSWENIAFYTIVARSKDGGRYSGRFSYFRGRLGTEFSLYAKTDEYNSPLSHDPLNASFGISPFARYKVVFREESWMKKRKIKEISFYSATNIFDYWNGEGPYQRILWGQVIVTTDQILWWDYSTRVSAEGGGFYQIPGEKSDDTKISSTFTFNPSSDNSLDITHESGDQRNLPFILWRLTGKLKIKEYFKFSSSLIQKDWFTKERQAIISFEIGEEEGFGGAGRLVASKTEEKRTLYSPTVVVRYIEQNIEGHLVFDRDRNQENGKIENKVVFKIVSKDWFRRIFGK